MERVPVPDAEPDPQTQVTLRDNILKLQISDDVSVNQAWRCRRLAVWGLERGDSFGEGHSKCAEQMHDPGTGTLTFTCVTPGTAESNIVCPIL